MKRFIDLRGAGTGCNFAWFDTITDTFEDHGSGECWESWDEFEQEYKGDDIQRYKSLCPKWIFKESEEPIVCETCRVIKSCDSFPKEANFCTAHRRSLWKTFWKWWHNE